MADQNIFYTDTSPTNTFHLLEYVPGEQIKLQDGLLNQDGTVTVTIELSNGTKIVFPFSVLPSGRPIVLCSFT